MAGGAVAAGAAAGAAGLDESPAAQAPKASSRPGMIARPVMRVRREEKWGISVASSLID